MADPRPSLARWIPLVLAAATLAVYWRVTTFRFVRFDDPAFTTENVYVPNGLTVEGFKWAWRSTVAANWHPITLLSYMLDCQLFGLKPGGSHLVNLLWHAANAVLLYCMLRRMTGAVWRSAVVAALFAWHPLHVESVVWVAERKDVLSAFFWITATWAYVEYTRADWRRALQRSPWDARQVGRALRCAPLPNPVVHPTDCSVYYCLAGLLFVLGLMSKPMLVTVPFTWLLLDYWPLQRWNAKNSVRLLLEKAPFFLLSVADSVVTYCVQDPAAAGITHPARKRILSKPCG